MRKIIQTENLFLIPNFFQMSFDPILKKFEFLSAEGRFEVSGVGVRRRSLVVLTNDLGFRPNVIITRRAEYTKTTVYRTYWSTFDKLKDWIIEKQKVNEETIIL